MIQPMGVRVDLTIDAGYVTYANGTVAETIEVWEEGRVAADVDHDDRVIGIEVLGLDPETLDHARSFATSRGLAFPAHLEGVASA